MNNVSPIYTGLKYGFILALISQAINYITYFSGLMTNEIIYPIIEIVSLIAPISLIPMAIKHHRNIKQKGHITFGMAFSVGILTSLVNAILGAIFGYILYAYFATNLLDDSTTAIDMSLYGLLGGIGFGAVLSVISSFYFKN